MNMEQELAKAKLIELDSKIKNEINPDKTVTVQFNPESLKVSFSNQIAKPEGTGNQTEAASMQFVGTGSTKLSLQLWFDVNAEFQNEKDQTDDVRKLTEKIAYFITPNENTQIIPVVRFEWGTFQFDGIVESMEESLEMFSNDGKPQRASITLGISQQRITKYAFANGGTSSNNNQRTPGTQALTPAVEGSSIQSMAAAQGREEWQAIAQANGIENPRLLPPGQLVNMNPSGGNYR